MSEVTQLLDRFGLSQYHQLLADNGFDSLGCLYPITEHGFGNLDAERGDRRKLQQEMRRCGAHDSSGDLVASWTNSPWRGTLDTETSAAVSNGEFGRALSHPELESAIRSEVFRRQRNMHGFPIEGLCSEAWGYLTASVHRLRSTRSGHP